MKKAQTATLLVACIAILAVNLPYALPSFYKGAQQPVGSQLVAVYVPDPDSSALTVPVTNPRNGFSETGQRVSVYLRNDYRDDEIQLAPRLTLALVLGFSFLYATVTRFTIRRAT